MLLRPLPYGDSGRLAVLWKNVPAKHIEWDWASARYRGSCRVGSDPGKRSAPHCGGRAAFPLAGSAIGLAGSIAAGHALSAWLFGINAADPPTLLVVIAVLGTVTLGVSCLAAL